jgi:hypothetical protein
LNVRPTFFERRIALNEIFKVGRHGYFFSSWSRVSRKSLFCAQT